MKNALSFTSILLVLFLSRSEPVSCEESLPQISESSSTEARRQEALRKYLNGAKNRHPLPGPPEKGKTSTPPSHEYVQYVSKIRGILFSNLNWREKKIPHVATALIELESTGRIKKVTVVKSSGNKEFDEDVLSCVWKSNPLPPPPPSYYSELKSISLTFDSTE